MADPTISTQRMTMSSQGIRSGYSSAQDSQEVVEDLQRQLGPGSEGAVVFVFTPPEADGAKITALLSQRWPRAQVIGCTTAGEFTQTRTGVGGVSALLLPTGMIRTAAAELGGFGPGTTAGIDAAVERLQARLGRRLRDLDAQEWIGFVLIDGLHGQEEAVNLRLGQLAPYLSFVGGSAGDNLEFSRTRVFCNGNETDHGVVLLVIELAVPHAIFKTCSLEPRPEHFIVTRADTDNRTVYEVDGRPVLDAYATALGLTRDQLDSTVFMRHPWGLMIDGQPWVRSPQAILADGGLKFYCQVAEGMDVHLMNNRDLLADMADALERAQAAIGGTPRGAVLFNCILRRLEMDTGDLHQDWLALLDGLSVAGFHTYGESWLGHINQTCTGVVFG